jgi:hypothetical protein
MRCCRLCHASWKLLFSPSRLQAPRQLYQDCGPILRHPALALRLLADLPGKECALVRLQGLTLGLRQLWSRCRCHMRYRLYFCLYNRRGGLSCPPLPLLGREALLAPVLTRDTRVALTADTPRWSGVTQLVYASVPHCLRDVDPTTPGAAPQPDRNHACGPGPHEERGAVRAGVLLLCPSRALMPASRAAAVLCS